jgi:hypothetical protein
MSSSNVCFHLLTQLQEPWDQAKFEKLLIEWIVACDQPFDEVEKPEFVLMMEYKRDPTKFSLPKKDGTRRRIMTLGENTIEDTKAMFAVCDSFLSFGAAIINLFN